MRISVAGAGAGKTTKMASKIINKYSGLSENRNIYCITFTNNATVCIQEKLSEYFGVIPNSIKVSTIHSFLYQEYIKPYYYLLYQKQFDSISNIKLHDDPKLSRWKVSQLEKNNVLHITSFTEKAKWVILKKSSDRKREKNIRTTIIKTFAQYCGMIFIDEAQDIDKNFVDILKEISKNGIEIEIMGDPKQDLKGFGSLRKLMEYNPNNITYTNDCYRCPQNHLNLSNSIIPKAEWQASAKPYGAIKIVFESDINVIDYIMQQNFDLQYISQRNDRYDTHGKTNSSLQFDTLYYEIKEILFELHNDKEELFIKRVACYYTNRLINRYKQTSNLEKSIKDTIDFIKGDKEAYAKIINALKLNDEKRNQKVSVDSIDGIKGQEGEHCLFIMTTDLVAYLFKKKTDDNKTKNKLYVALTRSLDKLTILMTNEVEEKYGRESILKYLSSYF